ncbi:YMGG-like glycine zipper-containing protein [Hymenobacter arizonensis]|uniref:Glycine zipper n=1 Tax=Hymenobacter arizonensis TaxID=1227077 RepID=A0A1I5V7C6_HYMAR|nr:YMGG-like glycine zipper-containing protein [Hymenobacter arizonensis]SFQ03433.1 Glycine zipper [Hymenobacter arizonensis]
MNKLAYFFSLIVLLGTMFSSSSAQAQDRKGWSPQAKGAVIGGLGGAAAGAIINKRNRPVGGLVGGVVGGGVGYAIGKNTDNKRKERARIAAANQAAANRAAANRAAIARNNGAANRATPANASYNSLAATPAAGALALSAQDAAAPMVSNSAYLPNNAYGDPSHPYATSEYRRKSW